ncbi:MAG TPA: hypothetical protein VGQ04_17215 [Chitinophagaceae bacterium]|jgi:hypothetical protein|nr:hypothetical protein [Chitinophagaceae bacterium]
MKKILLLTSCYLSSITLAAQESSNSIQLSGGKSWHGTGDLNGIIVDVSYKHHLKKRIDLTSGIATTIHYGKDKGFNSLFPDSSPEERLINFTTAGVQLNSILNYSLIYSRDNQFKAGAGLVLRFQSSSRPDRYAYYQDPSIFPEPFYVFYNTEKQNIFAAGYTFGLSFLTKISSNYEIGLKAFFQNDTNADAITYISLIIGRNLRRNQ